MLVNIGLINYVFECVNLLYYTYYELVCVRLLVLGCSNKYSIGTIENYTQSFFGCILIMRNKRFETLDVVYLGGVVCVFILYSKNLFNS